MLTLLLERKVHQRMGVDAIFKEKRVNTLALTRFLVGVDAPRGRKIEPEGIMQMPIFPYYDV